MGCWNATCGVSQLPIVAGTKVKTFLLLQSQFADKIGGSNTCYNTGYFRPWFFPVTAKYNDYGSIENIEEDWNSKYMLTTFQRWLAEGEVKILSSDKCEINSPGIRKFKTLSQVFDCVERGALVFKNHGTEWNKKKNAWVPSGGYLKISLFMVLDNIHDDLVKETDRFVKSDDNEYYRKRHNESRDQAIEAINTARSEVVSENASENKLNRMLFDMSVDRLLGDLIEEHFCLKHYKSILYKNDVVSVEDFMNSIDTIGSFSTAMTYLRKQWFPQTGSGSQSEELSFNKALISGMNRHIDEREKVLESYRLESEAWDRKYEAEQAAKKEKKKK
jgi:hypothetical protein